MCVSPPYLKVPAHDTANREQSNEPELATRKGQDPGSFRTCVNDTHEHTHHENNKP